jgi:hypothetical protein
MLQEPVTVREFKIADDVQQEQRGSAFIWHASIQIGA